MPLNYSNPTSGSHIETGDVSVASLEWVSHELIVLRGKSPIDSNSLETVDRNPRFSTEYGVLHAVVTRSVSQ